MANPPSQPPALRLVSASTGGAAQYRPSSEELVAQHIRRLIFTGELPSGSRVRPERICAELGVSVGPVREALTILDAAGWVTIEAPGAAFVQPVDQASLEDHYRVYSRVYGLIARRAAERANAAARKALSAARNAVSQAPDPDALLAANDAYLRQLLAMAGSPRLGGVLRELRAFVPGNFFTEVPGAMANQKRGITAVTAAVIAGDEALAEAECSSFMTHQGDAVIALLSSRHLFSSLGA